VGNFDSVNLFFQDESRFGLFTRNGKSITAINIKPICKFQQIFKSTWLSGAFSPITRDHFQLILPHSNTDNFQIFLDNFSKENPSELKIMVLDNGRFTQFFIQILVFMIASQFIRQKKLIIPENIALVFLPPYSPANLIPLRRSGKSLNEHLQIIFFLIWKMLKDLSVKWLFQLQKRGNEYLWISLYLF
jgi:hypothetical protein